MKMKIYQKSWKTKESERLLLHLQVLEIAEGAADPVEHRQPGLGVR